MNDLDLYNACMNFCRVFANTVAHQSQLNRAKLCFSDMEVEELLRKVEYEEKWVKDAYDHLRDVIDKLEEHRGI